MTSPESEQQIVDRRIREIENQRIAAAARRLQSLLPVEPVPGSPEYRRIQRIQAQEKRNALAKRFAEWAGANNVPTQWKEIEPVYEVKHILFNLFEYKVEVGTQTVREGWLINEITREEHSDSEKFGPERWAVTSGLYILTDGSLGTQGKYASGWYRDNNNVDILNAVADICVARGIEWTTPEQPPEPNNLA